MQNVTFQDFTKPATLFRVGHRSDSTGLWYDSKGRETKIIKTVHRAASAELPMSPHPIFVAEGLRWISVADSIETLKLWFPERDMLQLAERGYAIQEIKVNGYRKLNFEHYAHEVYTQGQLIDVRIIDTRY